MRTAAVGNVGSGSTSASKATSDFRQVRHAVLSAEFLHAIASHWPDRRYGERATQFLEASVVKGAEEVREDGECSLQESTPSTKRQITSSVAQVTV